MWPSGSKLGDLVCRGGRSDVEAGGEGGQSISFLSFFLPFLSFFFSTSGELGPALRRDRRSSESEETQVEGGRHKRSKRCGVFCQSWSCLRLVSGGDSGSTNLVLCFSTYLRVVFKVDQRVLECTCTDHNNLMLQVVACFGNLVY